MRERPTVIIVTDGTSHTKFGVTAQDRHNETLEAMQLLGLETIFWHLGEKNIDQSELAIRLAELKPEKIYAPAIEGGHIDHDVVGRVCDLVFPSVTIHYSAYTKDRLYPLGRDAVVPTLEEQKLKEKMLSCYPSQIRINPHHFLAVQGRNEYYT